ncbi:MAG TPA: diguanylate cyclase [Spongiibacteraceae bacterium]|nr:diguanylate cyclase [Spongiibacteraceae bacterium]
MSVFAGFIAAASAFLLWPRLKIAFAQSSFDDVGDADSGLSHHARLRQLNCELEQRVEERTQALEASNRELAQQVIMREYVQQELRSSNENLNRYIEKLERQNEDITWLNVLSDQLHCCDTHGDLARVLEQHCQDYFDTDGGALFEWHGEQLKLKSSWGCWVDSDRTFSSQAVLALRLGRLFPDSAEEQSLVPTARNSDFYVLMAGLQSRDNGIGALVLLRKEPFWTGTTVLDERSDQLLRALADHTALALSNLMLRERLREQSLSDPLTGLYNRRYLYQQLARLIALWERGGESFAVILIDVDHFKSFNDRFGHEVGDEVLVAIADVLQSEVRKSDIACRMGGEEFVILMAGAGIELARERAESLRVAVKMLRLDGAQEEVVTISAGVALYPEHGADAYSLVRAADKALYESKRAGRDCISLALSECD